MWESQTCGEALREMGRGKYLVISITTPLSLLKQLMHMLVVRCRDNIIIRLDFNSCCSGIMYVCARELVHWFEYSGTPEMLPSSQTSALH